ncbi:MAG: class I SAM-dependent methyltransferase [Ilumatobacteraceae bacterium]
MSSTPPSPDAGRPAFPPGFFDRVDPLPDTMFYEYDRMVTHIDDRAIAAVGALYTELGIGSGKVLDLMSSWLSHFETRPDHLTVLGMNQRELLANQQATAAVVSDLNADPTLPFDDGEFDAVTCCVSVDYLVNPIQVFREVRRVLKPGGWFVNTFSNRCFPTKVIRGWMMVREEQRGMLVGLYYRHSAQPGAAWDEPVIELRTPANTPGDPLWAVYARAV